MSGAEILAALEIVAAAAGTAAKVFEAIHAGKDLFDSFGGNEDYSDKLSDYINQVTKSIQNEIQAVELQGYMNIIHGAGLWYYRCQTTIQKFGINNHTVKDPDGELYLFSQGIMQIITPLDSMKLWIETDTRPRPSTAKMLGVYLTYYAIRHSVLVTYEAFELIRTGHNSATFGDLVQNLKEAQNVLDYRFRAYKSAREGQLVLRRTNIPGDPPGTGPLFVTDYGGDTLIPNLGGEHDFNNNAFRLVKKAWDSTEFGGTTIPNLFKTYSGAYNGGLSLLNPHQLERIKVFEHNLNAMDGFTARGTFIDRRV